MHTLPSLFRNSKLKEHLTALHVSFWRQQWKCADNLSPGKKSVPLWISPVTLLCHCTRSLLQCENSSSLHILIAPHSDHILLSNNNLFPNGWKLMMAEPISARLTLVTQRRSWKAFLQGMNLYKLLAWLLQTTPYLLHPIVPGHLCFFLLH